MCVIIIKKKGTELPLEVAKNSSKINPHGLGVVWLDTFDITYHKSSEYKVLHTDRPFIAHFRYATVGAIGLSNTHPFQCGKKENEYLMMNGTIKGLGDKHTCDSKVLAQNIGEMPRKMWREILGKHDCRFVTIDTKKRSFEVYNKELWTVKDGVWYSKDNVLEDNLVAVYGTLKKGNSNYYSYLYNSKFVGSGKTLDKYPLIVKGLPYLIEEVDKGYNVEVDVFAVSDSKLADLDRLEGHPHWYCRKKIKIKMKGKVLDCWVYFNIKERVHADSVLHKSFVQSYSKPKRSYEHWGGWMDREMASYISSRNYKLDEIVDTIDEFPENNAPLCPTCWADLKYDGFSNYFCSCCVSWIKESDVKLL